jgi:hypothetical protein
LIYITFSHTFPSVGFSQQEYIINIANQAKPNASPTKQDAYIIHLILLSAKQ